MFEKTKTVSFMVLGVLVVLIVLVVIHMTTKQTVVFADGKTAEIKSTNLIKKS